MKCNTCGGKAAIQMRQHKLALCGDHFIEWLPAQVQRFIEKYRMFTKGDRILAAVSGGKDSLALWDMLWRLGYAVDGLYIGLGIDGESDYSDKSRRLCEQFAAERSLRLLIVDIPGQYGETIPDVARRTTRGKTRPCAVCGLTKRHVMNRAAREGGYDVLVTGHNLDDEAAVLLGNTMNWLTGHLARQHPVLPSEQPGLARKAKPLCRIYERETAAYALLRGIEYIYEECPYAAGAKSIYYKDILNRMENDRPGAKLSFYLGFLQAKQDGMLNGLADSQQAALHTCRTCGQPTTSADECAFCRMWPAKPVPDSAPLPNR